MFDNAGHTNGAKKTRQGKGKNTKFGTKPQTHLGAVPKKDFKSDIRKEDRC